MRNGTFIKAAAISALTAVLIVSVLPAGQLPKRTGPCGQSLCHCPAILFKCLPSSAEQSSPEKIFAGVITLHNALDGVEGVSFQSVVTGLELPLLCIAPALIQKLLLVPSESNCWISERPQEIPTPPPRA